MLNRKLESVEWRSFAITDVFDEIFIAKSTSSKNRLRSGTIPFIGRSETRNGFQGEYQVENKKINDAYYITVAMVGTPTPFYHKYSFTCSQNVLCLKNKAKQKNFYINMFLITTLQQVLRAKGFNYGNPVSLLRFKNLKVCLPATGDCPDWTFMEQFMEDVEKQVRPNAKPKAHDIYDHRELGDIEWKLFRAGDLFEIQRGQRLTRKERKEGCTPYISSTAFNNGIGGFVVPTTTHSNCLTINNSGSVGLAFFQPYIFMASDHVTVLKNKNLGKYNGLFIASILSGLKEKYSFSREINNQRLRNEMLLLPTKGNSPDWDFMDQYMKRIEKTFNHP